MLVRPLEGLTIKKQNPYMSFPQPSYSGEAHLLRIQRASAIRDAVGGQLGTQWSTHKLQCVPPGWTPITIYFQTCAPMLETLLQRPLHGRLL